jgi:hypothetical protein
MNKFGKIISFALVTTMLLGSTFTSFAAHGGRETANGEGAVEGNVNQTVWQVDLPTVPEEATPFNYIMDPQRLISRTKYAKYQYSTFPDKDVDTGVYFYHGLGTNAELPSNALYKWENESVRTTVTNMGSDDIEVTVKVEAGETNVPLVESDAIATAQNTSLYLGLAYDDKKDTTDDIPETVLANDPAIKRVIVKGNEDNFNLVWDPTERDYAFQMINGIDETSWDSMDFYLKGAVTGKDVPAGTEDALAPPQLTVTWSWLAVEDIPTVTFVTGDGGTVIEPQTIHQGELVQKPQNPTRVGIHATYEFENWYLVEDPTEEDRPFNFEVAPEGAGDIILYANWIETPREDGFYSEATVGSNGSASVSGNSLIMTKTPAFSAAADIEYVWVNGVLLDNSKCSINTIGTLILSNTISQDVDNYVVYAIIDGEGYKGTFTKPQN